MNEQKPAPSGNQPMAKPIAPLVYILIIPMLLLLLLQLTGIPGWLVGVITH